MPLVIPELSHGNNKDDWQSKLVGKTISESTSDVTTFAKKDLPKEHRIVKPNDAVTMDYNKDRLNVYLDDEGIVRNIGFS